MGREATDKELSGGVMCDGLGSTANVLSKLPPFVGYIFGGSGIVPAALCALILNIVIRDDAIPNL